MAIRKAVKAPEAPALVSVTYSGPHDAVNMKLPDRWLFSVERGSTVEVTKNEAKALLAIPGWDIPTPPTPSKEVS